MGQRRRGAPRHGDEVLSAHAHMAGSTEGPWQTENRARYRAWPGPEEVAERGPFNRVPGASYVDPSKLFRFATA